MKRVLFIALSLLSLTTAFSRTDEQQTERAGKNEICGIVTNQDGKPVVNARVKFFNDADVAYECYTDGEGKYRLLFSEGETHFYPEVSASGHTTYNSYYSIVDVSAQHEMDFMLHDQITYKAGRCSSIILPVRPDASAGKYFRLSSFVDRKVLVFERELQPEANVPYVFIPYQDYVVDVSGLDLEQEAGFAKADVAVENAEIWGVPEGTERVDVVFFRGSYRDEAWQVVGTYNYFYVDDDPSCALFGDEKNGGGYRTGACHACIQIRWEAVQKEELKLQLVDSDGSATYVCPTGIEEMKDERIKMDDSAIYDLQGRNVQGSKLNAQSLELPKGIYIIGGRKVAVK